MRKPIKRLKEKVQKENLWLFIMKLLTNGKKYGSELREAVKENFGFWIGNVTAYKVLYLLENDGYVEKEKEGRKKYYKLTEKGKQQLDEAESFFEDTWKDLKS